MELNVIWFSFCLVITAVNNVISSELIWYSCARSKIVIMLMHCCPNTICLDKWKSWLRILVNNIWNGILSVISIIPSVRISRHCTRLMLGSNCNAQLAVKTTVVGAAPLDSTYNRLATLMLALHAVLWMMCWTTVHTVLLTDFECSDLVEIGRDLCGTSFSSFEWVPSRCRSIKPVPEKVLTASISTRKSLDPFC